jgi:hypothetical protein
VNLALAATDATREAERILRDSGQFKWYAVFLFVAVFYFYAVEVERRRFDIIAAGLAVWFADWINEVLNAVLFHLDHEAPLWVATGSTAYQILIGLNFEISMMFAFYGIVFAKSLPPDRSQRVLGLPNRLFYALFFSVAAVAVECVLNAADVLHWHWWWWNFPCVPLIVVFGYLWFFLAAAHAHDLPRDQARFRFVGVLGALAAALILVFGPILGWI